MVSLGVEKNYFPYVEKGDRHVASVCFLRDFGNSAPSQSPFSTGCQIIVVPQPSRPPSTTIPVSGNTSSVAKQKRIFPRHLCRKGRLWKVRELPAMRPQRQCLAYPTVPIAMHRCLLSILVPSGGSAPRRTQSLSISIFAGARHYKQ
jgi:hypothetical protein